MSGISRETILSDGFDGLFAEHEHTMFALSHRLPIFEQTFIVDQAIIAARDSENSLYVRYNLVVSANRLQRHL